MRRRARFPPVMVAVLVAAKVPKGRQCSSPHDCAGTASTTCTLDKTSGKKYCLCRDGLPPVNSKCAVVPTGRLTMSCQRGGDGDFDSFKREIRNSHFLCHSTPHPTVPGVTAMTRQSIGLPTALPGSGEAARGLSPLLLAPLAQAER